MADVVLSHVSKSFGDVRVIEDLSLEVRDEEFVVLVGPSGCGKSTVLRMIAGLEEVGAGEIRIGGRRVNELAPKDRDIAMVFQSYALYPHMTVRANLEFGLKMRGIPKPERDRLVAEAAQILDIAGLLDRKPKQLSGGQRQRVAVGRAIVRKPAVFLFDEPLSNLDAKLRVQMRAELSKLQRRLRTTTVYVTHDQVEAMTMGQRIVVLKDGRLQQAGTPLEVYERPANVFVANFIGTPPMNFFGAEVAADGARLAARAFSLPVPASLAAVARGRAGRRVTVGVRPDNLIEAGQPGRGPTAPITVEVDMVEPLGHEIVLHGSAGEDRFVAALDPSRVPRLGERIELAIELDTLHLFDPESEARLDGGDPR
jgi:multiple sugar transport system ATP-binding protein